MATHAFITTWLMAPSGSGLGVNWGAGMAVWASKGVFKGRYDTGEITVTGCNKSGISWSWGNEASLGGAPGGRYDGPDVYVWFRNRATKQEMGGFLDHWTLDRPRKRGFGNIKEGWHMDPGLILAQASHVMLGLQGRNGTACSKWTKL